MPRPFRILALQLLCIVAAALASGRTASAESFPMPASIVPRVDFWTRVYSEVGTNGGFIHDNKDLSRVYETVRVSEDPGERGGRALPVDRLLEGLNSEPALEMWRAITGVPEVAFVDGQATRYLPGHFLTRHDDDVEGKNRVAAYVLNLCPRWRPEWGGLLLFHDGEGDIARGLTPRFNALNLFAVPQLHSVSMVTRSAPFRRYAVTGWLRSG